MEVIEYCLEKEIHQKLSLTLKCGNPSEILFTYFRYGLASSLVKLAFIPLSFYLVQFAPSTTSFHPISQHLKKGKSTYSGIAHTFRLSHPSYASPISY
jgi:hypothetical protein